MSWTDLERRESSKRSDRLTNLRKNRRQKPDNFQS